MTNSNLEQTWAFKLIDLGSGVYDEKPSPANRSHRHGLIVNTVKNQRNRG